MNVTRFHLSPCIQVKSAPPQFQAWCGLLRVIHFAFTLQSMIQEHSLQLVPLLSSLTFTLILRDVLYLKFVPELSCLLVSGYIISITHTVYRDKWQLRYVPQYEKKENNGVVLVALWKSTLYCIPNIFSRFSLIPSS